MNLRRWLIAGLVCIVLLGGVIGGAYLYHRHRVKTESLVSLSTNQKFNSNGLEARVFVAGNSYDRTTVVVILHHSTPNPSRAHLKPGEVWSSDDPIEGLASSYKLVTHFPADPAISGLWIDGKERRIGDELTVVYISDKVPATDISIKRDDQRRFIEDARTMNSLQFIDKWVEPQLNGKP